MPPDDMQHWLLVRYAFRFSLELIVVLRACLSNNDFFLFGFMSGAKIELPNNLRAVLVDTKGPEIRTGPLQGNVATAEFAAGCVVEVTIADVSNDPAPESPEGPHRLNVDYQSIATTLKVGNQVLLDDGLIALEVTREFCRGGHACMLNYDEAGRRWETRSCCFLYAI